MKKVDWQVKENFVFPASAGMPTEAETINVTPRFTITRTSEAVRLTGIYHIAANIKLDGEVSREETVEEAVLIDDVDVQGETGYFEYAVPFHIDLPSEVKDPLKVVTTKAACEMDGQGAFAVVWDVECTYRRDEVAQDVNEEPPVAKEEKVEEEQVTAQQEETNVEKAVAKKEEAHEEIAKAEETKKKEAVNKEKKEEVVEQKSQEAADAATAQVEKASEPDSVAKAEGSKEKEIAAEKKAEQVVEHVTEEPVEEVAAASFIVEDTTFSDSDEALSFIAGLDDGISSTLFRSNDVTV